MSLEKKKHDFEVGDANPTPLPPPHAPNHHHRHTGLPRISKHLYSYLLISAYSIKHINVRRQLKASVFLPPFPPALPPRPPPAPHPRTPQLHRLAKGTSHSNTCHIYPKLGSGSRLGLLIRKENTHFCNDSIETKKKKQKKKKHIYIIYIWLKTY